MIIPGGFKEKSIKIRYKEHSVFLHFRQSKQQFLCSVIYVIIQYVGGYHDSCEGISLH